MRLNVVCCIRQLCEVPFDVTILYLIHWFFFTVLSFCRGISSFFSICKIKLRFCYVSLNAKPNLYLYLKHVFLVIVFGISKIIPDSNSACYKLLHPVAPSYSYLFVFISWAFKRKQKQHILSDSMCARETASTMQTTKHSFQKIKRNQQTTHAYHWTRSVFFDEDTM